MRTIKYIKCLTVVSLGLVLAACGGGGGGGDTGSGSGIVANTGSVTVLNGQVADGYLTNARVFLDRNGNRRQDNDEPWTNSGAQGRFSLDIQPGEGGLYPVVAEIIAGVTVDEDQSNQSISEGYILEAPAGHWSFVSPLTTLVKNELDKNPSLSFADAETRVRTKLGLSSGVSLFEDYLQQQTKPEMVDVHRAARITAALMGSLQADVEQNTGPIYAESHREASSLMISDQVMNNGAIIAQRLINAVDAVAVEEIKSSIMLGIDSAALNTTLLDRYSERILAANPVWDMTPPRVISQSPVVNGSASIDALISMTFDEALDPASVSVQTLKLSGPTGLVPGTVSYDPVLKQVKFSSEVYLMAFSSYRVDLTAVSDIYGNTVTNPISWSFTTIFDQLPPDLPNF
ncbi:Ig-like domain-containing protein [Geopsychrobacter electrodiphilus]|uniref:Ig-like domain-containing protein n=1 Tax=Geopsychrobacter electrodiphilus TaxID=225196 RepID=UPI00037F030F|nr:Ig-like domain-containing protein [Geopsychrobacter electrodiphilus]